MITPLRALIGSLGYFAYTLLIRNLVNMCMNKFDAEKKVFFDKLTGFLT